MPTPPSPDPRDAAPPTEGSSSAPDDAASPVGEAFAWASRILAIGLAMFLPGVGGNWLDARLGTRFLGPVGLIFGFTSALVWLVRIGNSVRPYRRTPRGKRHRTHPSREGTEKGTGDD